MRTPAAAAAPEQECDNVHHGLAAPSAPSARRPVAARTQLQHTVQPVPAQASAESAAQHQTELAGSLTQLKAALSAKIQGLEADLHARGKHAEAVSKQALELKSDVVTAQRAAEDARTNAAAAEERAKVSRRLCQGIFKAQHTLAATRGRELFIAGSGINKWQL